MSEHPTIRSHRPAASPTVRWIIIIVGLGFLALSGVAGFDLYHHYTGSDVQPLIPQATEWIGTTSYQPWMMPAGAVAALVGLIMLWLTVRPRTKTHRALTSDVAVWVRPVDVARMCTAQAQRVPGVLGAHTVAKKRRIDVTVIANPQDTALQQRITEALQPMVSLVAGQPSLRVHVSKKEGAR